MDLTIALQPFAGRSELQRGACVAVYRFKAVVFEFWIAIAGSATEFQQDNQAELPPVPAFERRGHNAFHQHRGVDLLQEGRLQVRTTHFLNGDGKPLRKSLLEHRWCVIRHATKLVYFHWQVPSVRREQGAILPMVGAVLDDKSPSIIIAMPVSCREAPVTGYDVLTSYGHTESSAPRPAGGAPTWGTAGRRYILLREPSPNKRGVLGWELR